MNSRKSAGGNNNRPPNLDDDETNIRPDEDYRLWCRQDGEQVIIRQRKIYIESQVKWIFEVSDNALLTMKRNGLRAPKIGTVHIPGSSLIHYIDSQTEAADA